MLKNYLKIAFKVMLRRKFFTAVSLFGISFTLLVLLVVTAFIDNEVAPRAPESEMNRSLYVVHVETGNDKETSYNISAPTFYFINNFVKTLKTPELVTMFSWGNGTTEYVNGKKLDIHYKYADAEFWEVFSFDFVAGKPFDQTHIDQSAPVAIINQDIANEYFNKEDPVGETIELNKKKYRVLGVVENVPYKNWTVGPESKVWLPYSTITQDYKKAQLRPTFAPGMNAVLLAREPGDLKKIKAEYQEAIKKVSFTDPESISWLDSKAMSRQEVLALGAFFINNNSNNLSKDNRPNTNVASLYLWLGVLALVFMSMPAINLMNLNSSRTIERSSEIGIRKAFGASSNTLVGQFITENILVTLVGASIGYVFTVFLLDIINDSGYLPYSTLKVNFMVFVLRITDLHIFRILIRSLSCLQNVTSSPCKRP